MVLKHREEHPSQWVASESIAGKIGCVPETLHIWAKQRGLEAGQRDDVTAAEVQRTKNQWPPASSNDIKQPSTRTSAWLVRREGINGD